MSGTRDRIAFAADLELDEAVALYPNIRTYVGVAKVGLSLFVRHGPEAVRRFQDVGAEVFLDLKLHDIPNTVENSARAAAMLGVRFLTIHASGGSSMVRAAVRGAAAGAAEAGVVPPTILAVTVLTSMGEDVLAEVGAPTDLDQHVVRLGGVAVRAGAGGLVCSPREAQLLRSHFGASPVLCTPGIRGAGDGRDDQQRVETAAAAIAAGSSLLVIGRPIYRAASPAQAAEALYREVEGALGRSPSR